MRLSSEKLIDRAFGSLEHTLIFPHVATDVTSFWTGVAIVNGSHVSEPVRILGYDADGKLLAEEGFEVFWFLK